MFRGIWLPPNTEEAARGIYIELVEKVLPQCNTECCKFQIPPSAATRNQYHESVSRVANGVFFGKQI